MDLNFLSEYVGGALKSLYSLSEEYIKDYILITCTVKTYCKNIFSVGCVGYIAIILLPSHFHCYLQVLLMLLDR